MPLRYNVRSRYLVDIVNDLKQRKLILAPYFQRKLVWREGHKVDFVKTILLGFPFPEVFFSRGRINLTDMTSTSAVVDGQQRLSTIRDFVENKFAVDGRLFTSLSVAEKEQFLKYEIAIIDLDLADDDSTIIDIFQRLNRTFYALSMIEKQATEYASSEFMLVAKFLAGEVGRYSESEDFELEGERVEHDPNISEAFVRWCMAQNVKPFHRWLIESGTFSIYEMSRQIHLAYTLLLMSTVINGISQRNDQVKKDLERYGDQFEGRDAVVRQLIVAADHVEKARPVAFWRRKANAYSLLVATDRALQAGLMLKAADFKKRLNEFAVSAPEDYLQAAKEGVNNRKERLLRHKWICEKVFGVEIGDVPKKPDQGT